MFSLKYSGEEMYLSNRSKFKRLYKKSAKVLDVRCPWETKCTHVVWHVKALWAVNKGSLAHKLLKAYERLIFKVNGPELMSSVSVWDGKWGVKLSSRLSRGVGFRGAQSGFISRANSRLSRSRVWNFCHRQKSLRFPGRTRSNHSLEEVFTARQHDSIYCNYTIIDSDTIIMQVLIATSAASFSKRQVVITPVDHTCGRGVLKPRLASTSVFQRSLGWML